MADRPGISRRKLLQTAAAGGVAAAGTAFLFRPDRPIEGSFVDRGHVAGHRIRDSQSAPPPPERVAAPVVVVGAGIAGLSAAWRMHRLGFRDFVVLELEDQAGGNSRWGENEVSAYPWGSHYIPVPDKRIPLVQELFEELGVIQEGRWDTGHFCREPQQRLFLDGHWQEGLEPGPDASKSDRDQFDRFWDRMDYYRQGGEFTIPIQRPRQTEGLDHISMKTWMVEQGFFSSHLRWYVDYACRDDYGASYADTSAWAGIHYFAARPKEDIGVLTWTEGNGWIVKRLLERLHPYLRTSAPVHRILRSAGGLEVLTEQAVYTSSAVIFAAPTFLAPYIIPEIGPDFPSMARHEYSPWYTANVTLDCTPRERGASPAWENILYDSPGLGYVVATHQGRGAAGADTVWTYYRALTEASPRVGRVALLETNWDERKEEILRDLEQAHADIRDCTRRLDVMRLGHAMIRPAVGFITSEARKRLEEWDGPIQFASSDLSGISIFEEAQYRGVRAADRVLKRFGFRDLDYA